MSGFWKTWLDVWCWMILGVGVMFALNAFPTTQSASVLFYDAVSWPIDGNSAWNDTGRFSTALIGAITIGWALTIMPLVKCAHQSSGPQVWRSLTFAMLAWFVIDSFVSVVTGVPGNAVSNAGFVGLFLVPILWTGVLKGA